MYLYREMTHKQVAETMLVSEKSVQRYVRLFNVNGSVSENQQRNGPCRKLSKIEELTVMKSLLRKPKTDGGHRLQCGLFHSLQSSKALRVYS